MQILIKFTKPLVRLTGSGWKEGEGTRIVGTGVIFPKEVITFENREEHTLALKPPTRLELEDDVVILEWESPEKTITRSVHTNLIASLTLKRQ